MARKYGTSETLDEIQSVADQLSTWLQGHLWVVVGGIVALLLAAGLVSYGLSERKADEREASEALAKVRTEYLAAMGAAPGSIEVPKLASAEAAKRIREDYAARFAAVADAHPGTVSGALARMEVAQLATDAGNSKHAVEVLERVLKQGADGDRLRGMVLQRIAQAEEDLGNWAEAADRHEAASKLPGFPLRFWALADAARCREMAGDRDAARALYERLATEAPDLRLPDYQRAEMKELEATVDTKQAPTG